MGYKAVIVEGNPINYRTSGRPGKGRLFCSPEKTQLLCASGARPASPVRRYSIYTDSHSVLRITAQGCCAFVGDVLVLRLEE